MIAKTLARTGTVIVEAFWHAPGEGAAAVECWPATSLAFTAAGAWWLHGRGGSGLVDPGWLLAGRACEEYECVHPDAVTDPAFSLMVLRDVEPVSLSLVPVDARGQRLRRCLYQAVTARQPDPDEIDATAAALLAWARRPDEARPVIGARAQAQVAEVRAQADR